jgi:hypothetical protein
MRIIRLLPAALLLGMAACNNAGDKAASNATDTSKQTASHDSMAMNNMADTSKGVTALPEVPAGARVYFKNLKNGQTVKSPLKVEMGVDGMKLDTAGSPIAMGTGHHHILIDAGDSIPAGTVVPKDEHHLHFGKAQSVADVTLAPGTHVLTLQFADAIHRSYGSKLATSITVTVK